MKINKEIFLKFLEDGDWDNDKTFSLFQRLTKEKDDEINKLEEEVALYFDKYKGIKNILDETLKNYEECICFCSKLQEENEKLRSKITKNTSSQTNVYDVKKASVNYEISTVPYYKPVIREPLAIENQKTLTQNNLDKLWDESKDIILNHKKSYKEKNKHMIVLFVDYKNGLIEIMGKDWYEKCKDCVREFADIDDKQQITLYVKIMKLMSEVFECEW